MHGIRRQSKTHEYKVKHEESEELEASKPALQDLRAELTSQQHETRQTLKQFATQRKLFEDLEENYKGKNVAYGEPVVLKHTMSDM